MIKKNYSLILTVLEKQPTGLEEIYRLESLPDRTKMMLRNPGGPLTVISDVEELLEAINIVKQFCIDNPTEVHAKEVSEAVIPSLPVVEYGLHDDR